MADAKIPTQINVPNIGTRLGSLWNWLTAPSQASVSYEDRLKSQWVATVFLVLIPLGLVLSNLPNLTWPAPTRYVAIILLAYFIPLYTLSRLGRYRLVTCFAVFSIIPLIMVAIVQDPEPGGKPFYISYLLLPLLFASTILSQRATIILTVLTLASLAFFPVIDPTLEFGDILSGPFNIILIGSGLCLFGISLRDRLERHNLISVTAANTALQAEIAERKQVEAQLVESNERYYAVVMQTAACIFLVDSETKKILEVNAALSDLLGYTRAELESMTLYDFVAHDNASIDEKTELVRDHGNYYLGERMYRTKKGRLIVMDVRVNMIHYSGKEVMCVISHDITSRKASDERLRASLQEKETLLKEIHHRVKNNLQVISSLLNLQSIYLTDPQSAIQFQESQARIQAMALIHERLYRSEDLARIDFGSYLQDLTSSLVQTYRSRSQDITVHVEADVAHMSIDTAIPCGLLVNELVSNALKHAFSDGRAGTIEVQMKPIPIGLPASTAPMKEFQTPPAGTKPLPAQALTRYQLIVRDNGIGFPADLDFRNTNSLGLQLVNNLVKQLGGTVELQDDLGTKFIIHFGESPATTIR